MVRVPAADADASGKTLEKRSDTEDEDASFRLALAVMECLVLLYESSCTSKYDIRCYDDVSMIDLALLSAFRIFRSDVTRLDVARDSNNGSSI